jgi:hypothetical protein
MIVLPQLDLSRVATWSPDQVEPSLRGLLPPFRLLTAPRPSDSTSRHIRGSPVHPSAYRRTSQGVKEAHPQESLLSSARVFVYNLVISMPCPTLKSRELGERTEKRWAHR